MRCRPLKLEVLVHALTLLQVLTEGPGAVGGTVPVNSAFIVSVSDSRARVLGRFDADIIGSCLACTEEWAPRRSFRDFCTPKRTCRGWWDIVLVGILGR